MLASIRNLKDAQIALRDRLNQLEREWLIGRLVSKRGIEQAVYDRVDPSRLSVQYDADLLTTDDVLDFFQGWGLHARPTGFAPRRWRRLGELEVTTDVAREGDCNAQAE